MTAPRTSIADQPSPGLCKRIRRHRRAFLAYDRAGPLVIPWMQDFLRPGSAISIAGRTERIADGFASRSPGSNPCRCQNKGKLSARLSR